MNEIRKAQSAIAFLAVISYLIFALAAFSRYPLSYSPAQNWLSDLGDAIRNPQGAAFYNLGILFTGLLLLLFFFSVSSWKIENRKIQNRMVEITQVLGTLGSIAMMLSAVFPINRMPQHQVFSMALYILLGSAFAFSVAALRYQPLCPRWALAVAALTAVMDIFSGIFHEVTFMEWATVTLFLAYLLILGSISRKLRVKPWKHPFEKTTSSA